MAGEKVIMTMFMLDAQSQLSLLAIASREPMEEII